MKIDSVLDTIVLIDLLRQNSTAILWQQTLGLQRVAITPIVWMQVIQGARNNSERVHILRFLRQFFIEHTVSGDHNWAMLQFAQYSLSHGVELTDVLMTSVGSAVIHTKHQTLCAPARRR